MSSFECCQLSCCSQTVSARSSAYGIQPIWPSEYASFSFGNSMSLPENSQSASDAIELLNASVPPTPAGASGDAFGFVDDEPMCMQSVTPVSLQTGRPGPSRRCGCSAASRWCGSSLKQIARTPRSALRRISSTARSTSHSGMRQSGMFTPPDGSHHSSTIQSLYALHAREPEVLVLGLVERLAAEAREGRERQRAVAPVEREVLDPRVAVVAAGAHARRRSPRSSPSSMRSNSRRRRPGVASCGIATNFLCT